MAVSHFKSHKLSHTHTGEMNLCILFWVISISAKSPSHTDRVCVCMRVHTCVNKNRSHVIRQSPLTRWCISWTAAWSRSSPSPCRWSRRGARRVSGRPPGLLSAAARPCGSRPPPRSPLLPRPGWCSAGTAPTAHTHAAQMLLFYNSRQRNSRMPAAETNL